jgi:hypothetical protein
MFNNLNERAASNGSPLGTPGGDWGWLEVYLAVPKTFGFEAVARSQMTTYKFMPGNLSILHLCFT